jgi:hypothetical protein
MPLLPQFRIPFVLAVACAAAFVGRPAWAQNTPLLTLSGGVAGVSDGGVSLAGFYVEGERRLTRNLSAVGQVHRATGSGEGYFSTIEWTDLFLGGGIRVSGRPKPWFEPFGQLLVGSYAVKTVEAATPNRFGAGTSDNYTDTTIATVVGGGANLVASGHLGLRVGLDLQLHPGTLPTARFTLGAVVPIGRR